MSGQKRAGRAGRCAIAAAIASAFVLVTAVPFAVADDAPAATPSPTAKPDKAAAAAAAKATNDRIQKLIRELGSPRYSARRAAASELRQIGAEAFDLLHAATEDADPEVAASANYLLRQIAVRWVQPEDSQAVRSALRQYGQEPEATRLQRVEQLAHIPQAGGVGALCRIARFDRSPIVSRKAALAIIQPRDPSDPRPTIDAAVVEQQLGTSSRSSSQWLRQFVAQQRDPAAAISGWKQIVGQEVGRAGKNGDTTNEIMIGLHWNLADLYRQVGDEAAVIASLDQMMSLTGEGADEEIVFLLKWMTQNKSWSVLDAFLEKYRLRLQGKRPLYFAAIARGEQGKHDLAEQLATNAAELPTHGDLEGLAAARELEERSKCDWAVREYRKSIDKQSGDTPATEPILARYSLSNMLHDYARDKEAADVLEPLVNAVQSKSTAADVYTRVREIYQRYLDLPEPNRLPAKYRFYRGCQYEAEKDYLRARSEYDQAIDSDPKDADVLIAMYNLPETEPAWREGVRKRIRQLAQVFQQQIDDDPTDPSPYNQWAWLISNTEGDFQKAVRYSQKSLELNARGDSGAASFLDTLGRCYYAVGDYENAVKCEQQALAKIGYMQVMHRQLALFEKALAEKKAAGDKPAEEKK